MLLLVMVPMSLLAYDRAQVEADAALIKAYEEESRIFKDLEWHDTATPAHWYAFWTIQALDIYSTHRGLKYTCIREGNPLLPEVPSIPRMITHKTVFLAPYWMLQNEGVYTKQDLKVINTLGAVVVYNNFHLWDKAKSKCTKR